MARRITRRRRPSPFMFGLGSLAKRRRRPKKTARGLAAASRKSCQKADGTLRNGFTFGKGGRCVRAKKH